MKNINDIYSKEDYKQVGEIFRAKFHSQPQLTHYEPYQLTSKDDLVPTFAIIRFNKKPISMDVFISTLKFKYAVQVWETAQQMTLFKYPDYLENAWVDQNMVVRKLAFLSNDFVEAKKYFLQCMKSLCKDERITVSESAIFEKYHHSYIFSDNFRLNVVLNVEKINAFTKSKVLEQFTFGEKHFDFSLVNQKFTYNQIKKYIVELDTHVLSLLNIDDCPLLEEEDLEIFSAAEKLDIKSIKNLVHDGVNINGINNNGETAFTIVVSASKLVEIDDEDEDMDIKEYLMLHSEYTNEEKFEVLKEMIELGADVNLFGYDGANGLYYAVETQNSEMVKFLLEHGANPNYNYDLSAIDSHYITSSSLDLIQEEIKLNKEKKLRSELKEIEKLLIEAGAK